MKKRIVLLAMVLLVCLAGNALAYTAGTYTATAPGFGGDVEVTITVDEDTITDVQIVGDAETEGVGSVAVSDMPGQILEAQSAEVDGLTGATFTSSAIKAAAQSALDQANGVAHETAEAVMKDGRYVAYAESFHPGDGLTVTVDINENRIRTIEVDTEHTSDMQIILQSAVDKLIPRMVEYQSVSIDAVCGATVSSNAIKTAVTDCVKQALAAAGSDESAIESFYASVPQVDETVELTTEVLVVGMGGAGVSTAAAAAQSGAQVLAIDKAGRFGGSSSLTCDVFGLNPPKLVEANGGEVFQDRQALLDDWLTYTEGDEKTEIVEKFIDASGEMIDWLMEDFDIQFDPVAASWFSTSGFVTCLQWAPSKWNNCDVLYANFGRMVDVVTENGGDYMLETEAYDLIYDEATNAVTGVKARNIVDGTEYVIHADAVVLATGGYMGNPDLQLQLLQETYYPLNGVWHHYGSKQNDGKMWIAAMNIGAGTYNANMSPEVHATSTDTFLTSFPKHYLEGQKSLVADRDAYWTEGDLPMSLGWSMDSLAIAPGTGERFTSETGVGMLDPWMAGPYFYSIWSDKQIEKIAEEGFDAMNGTIFFGSGTPIPPMTPIPNTDAVLDAAVEAGIMVRADSIEALAEQLGLDPETLVNTVNTYNGYCDTGVDEQYGKPAEFLDKVEGDTYYAVIMYCYPYGSCGGLDINEHFQVLKADDATVINGLYAVGTDSMGVLFTEKKPYVTYGGVNNSWGLTSGMLCGREIAASLAD